MQAVSKTGSQSGIMHTLSEWHESEPFNECLQSAYGSFHLILAAVLIHMILKETGQTRSRGHPKNRVAVCTDS